MLFGTNGSCVWWCHCFVSLQPQLVWDHGAGVQRPWGDKRTVPRYEHQLPAHHAHGGHFLHSLRNDEAIFGPGYWFRQMMIVVFRCWASCVCCFLFCLFFPPIHMYIWLMGLWLKLTDYRMAHDNIWPKSRDDKTALFFLWGVWVCACTGMGVCLSVCLCVGWGGGGGG